eukprot:TRINITY_DN46478_c0_g1_i1.p1 TRINITY_DN46478_c0_g1~~TRINITY_DN46478_c0_g1_i1.p1  ORF type:complete len:393 (-),score=40.51 TRINITY_DN46478_c0_g1_i1:49-1227(-)
MPAISAVLAASVLWLWHCKQSCGVKQAHDSCEAAELDDVEPQLSMLQIDSYAHAGHGEMQSLITSTKPLTDPMSKRYLLVLEAYEQFEGAIEFIADALHFAREQNRTFVEPALSNGRVVDPSIHHDWVPLSMMVDVAAMQQYHADWVGVGEFLHISSVQGSARKLNGTGYEVVYSSPKKRLQLNDATIKQLESKWNVPMLALTGKWQRLTIRGSWNPVRSKRGVLKLPSPYIAQLAARTVPQLPSHTVCAQWRSEGCSAKCSGLARCGIHFVEAVKSVQKREGVRHVLLLTDLSPNTSETYRGCNASRKKVMSYLEQELNFNSLRSAIKTIEDSALRALVESHLCAHSKAMVGCPEDKPGLHCADCARLGSKFTASIIHSRHEHAFSDVVTW